MKRSRGSSNNPKSDPALDRARLRVDVDAPILRPDEDLLSRSNYAHRIAEVILNWKGDHSFVLAIYGEWGGGKTSLKNLVVGELQGLEEAQRPIVVEFDPWEWTGTAQLTEAFFQEIANGIGDTGPGKAQTVSDRLSRYGAYFALGGGIADSLSVLLPLVAPGAGPVAGMLAQFFKNSGDQAEKGSRAKLADKSLKALHTDLIKSIQKLDRTILVVLDDVDRLTSEETALLFKLLKANADLPRIVYLVLCDRDVVARNLSKVVVERGDDFLKKIVQLGLHLPKAYPDQIRKMVLEGVQEIARSASREGDTDFDRFGNVYDEHAVSYFRTVRDVKRYLAGLEALVPILTSRTSPAMDLVDFFLLEILRVFEHAMYEAMYADREILVGFTGMPSKDVDLLQTVRSSAANGTAAIGILEELFPRFASARPRNSRSASVSLPQAFDRYFLFGSGSVCCYIVGELDVPGRFVGFRWKFYPSGRVDISRRQPEASHRIISSGIEERWRPCAR